MIRDILERLEAISEGMLSPATISKYPDRFNKFIKMISTGAPFYKADGTPVIIDPSEAARMQKLYNSGAFKGTITLISKDGEQYNLGAFLKTRDLGGTMRNPGSTDSDDDSDVVSNKGEIAEGILGAAMFAKFTKRDPDGKIGIVTRKDIERVLDEMSASGNDLYQEVLADAEGGGHDTISFYLKLKQAALSDLYDPKKRPILASLYDSALLYVNSERAETYARYFFLNERSDDIAVVVDGAISETDKKSDVSVIIKDPRTGLIRKLKLEASLKVGPVKQFGQVGGSSMDSMEKLWEKFGIDVSKMVKDYTKRHEEDPRNAIKLMYQKVAAELNNRFVNGDDMDKIRFINQLADAITYFATLGDNNVELVQFDKGGLKVLRFAGLKQKLHDANLAVEFVGTKSWPELRIYDKDSKETLLFVRVKGETQSGGRMYIRNYIEKGPFLEKLTKVEPKSKKPEETEAEIDKVVTGRVSIRAPGVKASAPKNTAGREKR